jgi:hypothetical protein
MTSIDLCFTGVNRDCSCKFTPSYAFTSGIGLVLQSSWNVMAHGDAREEKWRGNRQIEWVASILHTTSEHGVSSITAADAHTLAASSRLNWRPRRFKWTRSFRRKPKSGFCACATTFQTQSTCMWRKVWEGPLRISLDENGKATVWTLESRSVLKINWGSWWLKDGVLWQERGRSGVEMHGRRERDK